MIRLINVILTWNLLMEDRLGYRQTSERDQSFHTRTLAIEAHPEKISTTSTMSSKVFEQTFSSLTTTSRQKRNGFSSIDLLVETSTTSVWNSSLSGFGIIMLLKINNWKESTRFIPIIDCSDLRTSSTMDHMFALQILASHFRFFSLSFCLSLVHRRPHTDGAPFDERADHVVVLNDSIWSIRSWLKATTSVFTSTGRFIGRPAADFFGWF